MDLLADRIDKALFDLMFSDFDSLQEEYHDKLKTLFVSDQATQQIPQNTDKAEEREEMNMTKTIITQEGTAVNYANLVTISVESGEMPNKQTGEAEAKVGIVGTDVQGEIILLGVYDSVYAANRMREEILDWLVDESSAMFTIPQESN